MAANRKISKGKPTEPKTSKPTSRKSTADPMGVDRASLQRVTNRSEQAQVEYQAHLLEYINDAVVAVDAQSRITSWNAAAESLYGWTAVEVLGRPSNEIIRSDMTAEKRAEVLTKLHEFGTYRNELIQYRKDGSSVHVEANTIGLYDLERKFTGLLSVNRDITERKQVEAARDQLASIVEATEDAVLSKTLEGVITSWNRGSELLYGYTAKEAIGQSIASLIIPPDRPNELPDILERIKRGEHIQHYETIRLRKDGTQVNISISVSPMMDSTGNIAGASTIARNISARKQAEEVLRKSEERFSKAFLASPAGMIISRLADGAFLEANESFLRMFEYSREEVIGHSSVELKMVSPEERAKTMQQVRDTGYAHNVEQQMRKKSGRLLDALFSTEQIELNGIACALVTIIDISERKQAEKQIAQLNRLYATLSQVNQTIVRARSDHELYQSICNLAVEFGGFALVWIGLLDEATGDVKPVVANGLNVTSWPPETVNIKQGPFTATPIATALRTSRVVTSEEIPADQRIHNIHFRYQNHTYLSTAAVPFRLRGKTIGVVSLVSEEAGFFKSGEEIRLLEEMGLDISFALDTIETEAERKQAEKKIEQQNQRLLVLREIDLAILAADSVENIVGAALGHIHQLIDCRRADLTLIDWETNESVIFDVRMNSETENPKGRRSPLAEYQDIIQAFSQNQLLLISDLRGLADPRPAIQGLLKDGLQSLCSLPLFSQGTLIGMFSMFSDFKNFFDDEKINLAREVANQVAIAISQSRLVASLRESEQLFAEIFMGSPIAISMVSLPGGRNIEVNEAWCKLTGFSREEAIGSDTEELKIFDHEERTKLIEEFTKRGRTTLFESRIVTKAGDRRVVLISNESILIKGVQHILTSVLDITERKQVEQVLRETEERFRQVWESTSDSMCISDASGIILDANPASFRLYGYTPEQIIGQSIAVTVPEETREQLMHQYRAVFFSDFIPPTFETIARHADGTERNVESSITFLTNATGEHSAMLTTFHDITERKRATRELEMVYDQLKNLFDNLDENLFSVDTIHWKILQMSPACERIYGRPPSAFLENGQLWREVIHPDDLHIIEENDPNLFAGRSVRQEYRIYRLDGEIRWLETRIKPTLNADGRLIRLDGVSTDITQRKQAEESLRTSEQRYYGLFEDSPISIWEEDFSLAKLYLDKLRAEGVNDFRAYFATHIEEIMECASKVKITDVNKAALQMYQAADREEMLGNLRGVITADTIDSFQEELISLAEGRTVFQWEGTDRTLLGKPIEINLSWSVIPGYEHDYSKVIVSTIDISERKKAEAQTERQLERLQALRTIDTAISSSFNLKLTLEVVLGQVSAMLNIDAAAISLFHPITKTLAYAASRGFHSTTIRQAKVGLGDGYAGTAILERRTIHIASLAEATAQHKQAALLRGENFVGYYCAPLIVKGEVKGALEIFQRSALAETVEWVDFLETLAGQAAIAIENSQLFDGLQRSNMELSLAYDATIEGWSHALDLRDKETEGHSLRVTELTIRLAQEMGLSEVDLVHIRRGSLLHDIGKMGVPDNILLKPGKLTDSEWEKMRQHPGFAHAMLSGIDYLKPALDIPYCHHEKWDGSGYPRGLMEEQIPIAARIFAVIDVWDALRSDRPYRVGWSEQQTLEHIRSESGKHFDPQVVEAFLKLISESSTS